MTRKQLILLITGLILIFTVILIGSLFWKQKENKNNNPTESPADIVELASMDVYPERTEESMEEHSEPEVIYRTEAPSEEETALRETASKSRVEYYYETERDLAAWESYEGPEIDFDARPSMVGTGLPPTITGVTDGIREAVDGYDYLLIELAEIEAFRVRPTAAECRIEIFQKEEKRVIFSLSAEDQIIGFILYDKEKGTLEGGSETYYVKD